MSLCKTQTREGKDWCLTHEQPFAHCQPGRAPPRQRMVPCDCPPPPTVLLIEGLGHGRTYTPHTDED